MVVAAGAAEREPEDRLAERVDRVLVGEVHVVDRVEPEPPGNSEVARAGHTLREAVGLRRIGEQIAGHLLAHELVIWLVVVERLDHVVAILPGQRCRIVGGLAGGVGVADHVEPVPAPALAVGG